jgi:hypothetical protein
LRRQGRIICPEQERFPPARRQSAIQGSLSRGGLDRADKILWMFKPPGTLDRNWAKKGLIADPALPGPAL